MLLLPLVCTGIGLVSLTVMKQWEDHMPWDSYKTIAVECEERTGPVLPALTQYFATRHIHIVGANCTTTAPEGATYEFVIEGTWGDLEILSHLEGLAELAQVSRVRVG